MKYIEMEAFIRSKGWLYCGAGLWRKSALANGVLAPRFDLLDAYSKAYAR